MFRNSPFAAGHRYLALLVLAPPGLRFLRTELPGILATRGDVAAHDAHY
jgi:hypothetical protein